jgi:hypothetical protein
VGTAGPGAARRELAEDSGAFDDGSEVIMLTFPGQED